jgi:murein DD-endopeptidase MepM/ murein hydrolase activator NlpD
MKVSWTSGVLNAVHNDEVIYLPPLRPASNYPVVQGFGGGCYALDFAAPVGTPVFAARDGVVIDTKDDGQLGGASKRFAKHANFVAILHDDGTTGEYYHLKYKGVVVTREQTVKAGELIGYSGNTGFSSLPHLHFAVYTAKYEGKYMSVPFALKNEPN